MPRRSKRACGPWATFRGSVRHTKMSGNAERILLIGLDGGTWDVLLPLMEAGVMPHLGRLVGEGFGVGLLSELQQVTPAAWTSLSTGAPPQVHGVHDFRHYDPVTGQEGFVTFDRVRVPTVWEIAGRHVGPVVVVNLPTMFPPPALNGICVSGFDAPLGRACVTHPPELEKELARRFPGFYTHRQVDARRGAAGWRRQYTDRAVRATTLEADVGLHCLRRVDWRLAMVQFQTTDGFQHAMWSRISAGPADDADVRAFYGNLDGQIGRLAALCAERGGTTFVVSDHGFQAFKGRLVNVNAFLQSLGLIQVRQETRGRARTALAPVWRRLKRAWRRLHRGSRPATVAEKSRSNTLSGMAVRWDATRAYVPLCHICAYVYVNRRGREPGGTVAPDEVTGVVEEIRNAAAELADPQTGEHVFEHALTRREAFGDTQDDSLPDLVLVPAPGYSCTLRLKPGGRVFEPWPDGEGVHAPRGVLAGWGPLVKRRGVNRSTDCHIEEVAPAVLRLLGVRPPDYMAPVGALGDLVEMPSGELLEPAGIEKVDRARYAMNEDEAESIRKRLEDLGYLG